MTREGVSQQCHKSLSNFVQSFILATIKLTEKTIFYGKFRGSVGEGGFLHADFDSVPVSSRTVVLHLGCTLKPLEALKKFNAWVPHQESGVYLVWHW